MCINQPILARRKAQVNCLVYSYASPVASMQKHPQRKVFNSFYSAIMIPLPQFIPSL